MTFGPAGYGILRLRRRRAAGPALPGSSPGGYAAGARGVSGRSGGASGIRTGTLDLSSLVGAGRIQAHALIVAYFLAFRWAAAGPTAALPGLPRIADAPGAHRNGLADVPRLVWDRAHLRKRSRIAARPRDSHQLLRRPAMDLPRPFVAEPVPAVVRAYEEARLTRVGAPGFPICSS